MRTRIGLAALCVGLAFAVGASFAQAPHPAVLQLDVWRKAVLAGDAETLTPLYASSARIVGPKQASSTVPSEVAYWSGWKAKGL